MKIAIAYGIASMIPNNEPTDTNILPYILDAMLRMWLLER
ncbi:hypothetical protein MGH68_00275 [Erysipelothrix sp. D19-032]